MTIAVWAGVDQQSKPMIHFTTNVVEEIVYSEVLNYSKRGYNKSDVINKGWEHFSLMT
jgi:hypothetical protein